MRQILVPTDFSPSSSVAARAGMAIGRALGARVDLIHVAESAVPPEFFAEVEEFDRARLAEANAMLSSLASELNAPSDASSIHVKRGDVGLGILATAAETRAQLIVMSSLGRHGAQPLLLGSTAARIARDAGCPVLIFRGANDNQLPRQGLFTHPLIAVDYSRFSMPSVAYASQLATEDATIELCHAMFHPAFEFDSSAADTAKFNAIFEGAQTREQDRLNEIARQAAVRHKVRACVTTGRAADAVLKRIRDVEADVVVTGAHGRDTATDLLLGSVADRLLRQSPVPVLLIPDGALS